MHGLYIHRKTFLSGLLNSNFQCLIAMVHGDRNSRIVVLATIKVLDLIRFLCKQSIKQRAIHFYLVPIKSMINQHLRVLPLNFFERLTEVHKYEIIQDIFREKQIKNPNRKLSKGI